MKRDIFGKKYRQDYADASTEEVIEEKRLTERKKRANLITEL